MNEWTPTCFESDDLKKIDIDKEFLLPARRIRAVLRNKKAPVSLYPSEHIAYRIFKNINQKTIVESLLIAPDASIEDVSELLEIEVEDVEMYIKVFFDLETRLSTKLDLIGYIETGIQEAKMDDNEYLLSFYMFKKWAISLGKEFIIWKFSLLPTDVNAGSLYNTVVQEAFYFHKEKSLSGKEISSTDYQRSVNSLLGGLKTRQEISDASSESVVTDFMDNLDIIIQEDENTMIVDSDEFINNIEVSSKEEIEELFGKEDEEKDKNE